MAFNLGVNGDGIQKKFHPHSKVAPVFIAFGDVLCWASRKYQFLHTSADDVDQKISLSQRMIYFAMHLERKLLTRKNLYISIGLQK